MKMFVFVSSFRKQLGYLSGVGGSSDIARYSQSVSATVLVLCDRRTMLRSVSTLRLLSVLRQTLVWFWCFCKQILLDIRVRESCVHANCNCDEV